MINAINFDLYRGNGKTVRDRRQKLPPYEPLAGRDDPANYVADDGLAKAVNVALALGQPLLVTGEPGTGKTRLADSIAHELALPEPLVFHTKTTSAATDLFYHYDALARFQDSQIDKKTQTDPEDYITYQALGLAILLANPPEDADAILPKEYTGFGPTRSVVLIDEIDKAPRDLPNDILNEIEKMRFGVRETGRVFKAGGQDRPILVLTSNSEKNLPDAFLRRCIFYHISFPDETQLTKILERRFGKDTPLSPAFTEQAIRRFEEIRDSGLRKKPATAEFLAWFRVLQSAQITDLDHLTGEQADMLTLSYSVLAKTQEDLSRLKEKF